MRITPRSARLLASLSCATACAAAGAAVVPKVGPAKSPEESLKAVRVSPGFRVELVAAEPLVMDPVAIAWGADGRLWVAEMGDYPLGVDGKGGRGGRVKFLEDVDADGRYDKATLFLDDIGYSNGVFPWGKGVLITAAPDVLYAQDSDGDGKADKVEKLYTGFGMGNQQHLVNGLRWGLDNWVYGANGDGGAGANGVVKSLRTGKETDIRGRDFRVRPPGLAKGGEPDFDAATGPTQFGLNRDDWGNWFGSNNAQPMYHFVLDDRYLRRNPHLASPDPRVHVVPSWNVPLFGISLPVTIRNPPVPVEAPDSFSSACSAMVYRDELLGPGSGANAFVCDPVNNLVHRQILTPSGLSFTAARPPEEQKQEFFASADSWCRPTMIQAGPDGALYVVDMYRLVIEHPQWIEPGILKTIDVRAGHDKGRIYRVYPEKAERRRAPRLDELDAAGLAAALDSPSGWQRDTAQQLLVLRGDKSAVPALEKLAAGSERDLCRLHALCTLDGLGALTPDLLARALADPSAGVRRHAVRLCEPALKDSGSPAAAQLGAALVKLVSDADPQVRLQLACTLGEWDEARAGAALGELALSGGDDKFVSAAVMSSVTARNIEATLGAVISGSKGAPPAPLLEGLLRLAGAYGNKNALATLVSNVASTDAAGDPAARFAGLAGLLDALDAAGTPLAKLAAGDDAALKAALAKASPLFDAARAAAADAAAPEALRAAAVRLLGRGPDRREPDAAALAALLVPQTPEAVQAATVSALGRLGGAGAPKAILAGWKGFGPALRAHALDVLLGRDEWVPAVLDAVEGRKVLAVEVDAPRRQRLLKHEAAPIRARSEKLFADAVNPDRQKVIDAYAAALNLEGDTGRGKELFTKTCAACHRIGDQGNAVGPDLAAVGDKSPQGLLIAVIDPNRAVEAKYTAYVAQTKGGATISGLIGTETGASVTLVAADGKAYPVLRTDLKALRGTGISLMPEGLEAGMEPQDMADLIAYVRSAGPPEKPKSFPGNKPEVVKPDAGGTLKLSVGNAAVYGPNLIIEDKYRNLGYWLHADDRAAWTIEPAAAGAYEVWMDYACDNAWAGKGFVVELGAHRLTGKVEGTGTFDQYRRVKVGEATLAPGRHRAAFHSAGKIDTPLLDLMSIELVPKAGAGAGAE